MSEANWEVQLLGPGRCRFIFGQYGAFEVDTSVGYYGLIPLDKGKPQPMRRGNYVTSAIQGPRRWSITVQMPRSTPASPYGRLQMTMAGDLFLFLYSTAKDVGGPYLPAEMTFHKRQP